MPYASHSDLKTPADRTILWRYMDFARFVYLLENRALWFTRLDQLRDPLEGFYTDAELQGIRRYLKDEAEKLVRLFRESRRGLYVNCWREGEAQSIAMWDLYGKGSGIVAIKSTVGKLKKAIRNYPLDVFIARSRYLDWNEAPGLDNVLVAGTRKDASYKHEAEVRAMIMDFTADGIGTKGIGISIPIDLKTFLTEVVVGPREEGWVAKLVRQLMTRHNLSQPVSESSLLKQRT